MTHDGQESISFITRLFDRAREGDVSARNELVAKFSDEIYQIARKFMRQEWRRGHTLTTHDLAHNALANLLEPAALERVQNRGHFFGILAQSMRQVLTHHARRRNALKREGTRERQSLDDVVDYLATRGVADLPRFDELLQALSLIDERQRQVVEFRFFLEFDVKKTAELLGVSERTVELDWAKARAWLYSRLKGQGNGPS